jgi:plastocyanin
MAGTTGTDEATENRTVGIVAMLAGVAIALVLSAGALIVAATGGGVPPVAGSAPVASDAAADAPSEVAFELDDLTVRPAAATIAPGGSVEVVNVGAIPHDLVVLDGEVGTPMLDSGEVVDFGVDDLEPGTYLLICTVPGHREAGMEATLTVAGASDDGAVADHGEVHAGAGLVTVGETYEGTLSYDPNAAPPDGFEARDPGCHRHPTRTSTRSRSGRRRSKARWRPG